MRLGLARVLAGADGTLPVLLDDALLATDLERFRRMSNVLVSGSRELQLVVFTCRPELYGPLVANRDQLTDLEALKPQTSSSPPASKRKQAARERRGKR
jgi:uncharacterized protein YhaN